MLLLDTDALLWVLQDNPRLNSEARDMITDGWSVGSVAVSVVTFWQIAILSEKDKLILGYDPARWRSDRIADGIRELPLHGTEAVRAAALGREGFMETRQTGSSWRPPRSAVAATAPLGGHTLLPTDREILAWLGGLHRVDVRRHDLRR